MKKKLVGSLCAVAVLFSVLLVAGSPFAQEKADPAKPDAPARQRAEARGRLPNYFRQVVTPDQREKIYSIQAKYVEQIAVLEKQIADLEAKRDAEVDTILTPEQREKVKALAEEARKRREAASGDAPKASDSATPPATPAPAKPANK
jgi:Spy/CpxP family protein refolding chaperone